MAESEKMKTKSVFKQPPEVAVVKDNGTFPDSAGKASDALATGLTPTWIDLAMEVDQIGIWNLDIGKDTSVRNLRHDQIFGFKKLMPVWGIKNLLAHLLPEEVKRIETSFKRALEEKSWVAETRIIWPDKSIHWISIKAKVVVANKQMPLNMVGTICDISRQKSQEAEINQVNNDLKQHIYAKTVQLESANNEFESFAYSISHDLRAPLRAIQSYSQILIEEYTNKLDENGIKVAQRISVNSIKMGKLMEGLVEFSKLGSRILDKNWISINSIVKEVTAEIMPTTDLHYSISAAPLGMALADEVTVRVVFKKLLLNAAKFSSKKLNPLIEVGVVETDSGTTYFVKDNGAGFDMAYYHKLFGMFQRLHKKEEFEGTGAGLAIAKKMIVKHGGRMWAESILNEGTTFYFTLNRE